MLTLYRRNHEFEFLANTDRESTGFSIPEIELVHEVRNELEKSSSSLSEIGIKPVHFLHFTDLLHFFARLGLGPASGIADFYLNFELVTVRAESDVDLVLVEWHATVFDRIIHELVGNERESILPREVDMVLLEQVEYPIADHLGLGIIGQEHDSNLEVGKVGNRLIEKTYEIVLFEG